MGLNHRDFDGIQTLVSNAWCTTNCLAPMAMALDEVFGFEGGLMITVHSYTPDQYLHDVCTATGAARAAAVNVVPTSGGLVKTSAGTTTSGVIPTAWPTRRAWSHRPCEPLVVAVGGAQDSGADQRSEVPPPGVSATVSVPPACCVW